MSSDIETNIAELVREAIAHKRMSRQQLAEQARISLSTLEKALSGQRPFTLNTVVRLEDALGVSLRSQQPVPLTGVTEGTPGVAPEELGAYSRRAVNWLEGSYLVVRPAFSGGDALYTYQTEIAWSEPHSHLVFREGERVDAEFTQNGAVSVPHQSGYVYLVTNRYGQYRMIVLTRPTITGEMFGIISSLQATRGAHLMPVSTPIVFIPPRCLNGPITYGPIEPDHELYALLKAYVDRTVEEPFAILLK
ncbi:MAG: helix-turn-helix domain-containing protein [Hyphomicrobiales bacterium]|nr:helix-turn-helix domain-containing protein [Hyphomicrobiales bacterium]